VNDAPNLESRLTIFAAATIVPYAAAFKTHWLAALTVRSLRAAAKSRLNNGLAAVRLGTPLEVVVSTNPYILLDRIVYLGDLGRAKQFDFSLSKNLFALKMHARELHSFTIIYSD
jgi:hypothetical protein